MNAIQKSLLLDRRDRTHLPDRSRPVAAPLPSAPEIPVGPIVQEADGHKDPAPTFEDLLASPTTKSSSTTTSPRSSRSSRSTARYEGRRDGNPLALLTVAGRQYILVSTVHRPYSYQVPEARFPALTEVWGRSGNVVRKVQDTPLQQSAPRGQDAVEEGPRTVGWRADAPATLVWVEALDGGNISANVPKHDHLLALAAPFAGTPAELIAVESRIGGGSGGSSRGRTRSRDRDRSFAQVPQVARMGDRSVEPIAGTTPHVGAQHATTATAIRPLRDRARAFRRQRAPHVEGRKVRVPHRRRLLARRRPSVPNKYELATGKTTQLFRSEAPFYESPDVCSTPTATAS